jgi:nitrate reductase cytochrome c-type subunit
MKVHRASTISAALLAFVACNAGAPRTAEAPAPAPAPAPAAAVSTAQVDVPTPAAPVFDASQLAPPSDSGPLVVGEPSERRRVGEPVPWTRGALGRFRVAHDREAALAESLAARAATRAYEGAPPVIPHSADFAGGRQTCLDCHGEGMTIGTRVARTMGHHPMAMCTQCHVESEQRAFAPATPPANAFDGRGRSGAGERASVGAPPVIPHGMLLRQSCLGCHGEFGWPGLRTSHAGRVQCTQCHVPAASSTPLHPAFGALPR